MRSLIKQCLVVLLALCTSFAFADEHRNFQQIIDSGRLRIGVSIFPPWVMKGKDGHLIGSEIDMGRRLAADMGLKPEFGQYDWQELIPALNKGEIDVIISGMGIKPKRALKVNFSRPYGDSGIGLAANTGATQNIAGLKELNNPKITIGTIAGTVSEDLAKRMFPKATLVTVKTKDLAEQDLLKGKVQFLVAANPLPRFLALQYPGKVDVPLTKPLLSFKEGMAINKGDVDFLNFLDSWVTARTADAWIPSMRRYWFDSLNWKDQVK